MATLSVDRSLSQELYPNNLKTESSDYFGMYLRTVGEIQEGLHHDTITMQRVLHFAKDESRQADHTVYREPESRLERWKWIVGANNSLDRRVGHEYRAIFSLLEHTQSQSLVQKANEVRAYARANRHFANYVQFRIDARAQARSGVIKKIFFRILGFVFIRYYGETALNNVGRRSPRSDFVIIGGFSANGKDYSVRAYHDTRGASGFPVQVSLFDGEDRLVSYFKIYRRTDGPSHEEGKRRYGIELGDLEYTRESHGSDKEMDRKMTQVMVEMAINNREKRWEVSACYDTILLFDSAGFRAHESQERLKKLLDFRAKEGNKLFPPYRDFGTFLTCFSPDTFKDKNVYYSSGDPESWAEIIKKSPILRPDAVVLPKE